MGKKNNKDNNNNSKNKNTFMWYIALLGLLYLILQTGSLNDGNFFSSPFWRLEFQEQGGSRAGFWWSFFSWLIDSCLPASSLHGLFSVCPHLWYLYSHKDTSHVRLWHSHMTSFNHNYLLKGPVSKFSHILKCTGIRFSTYDLGVGRDTKFHS